MPLSDSFVYSSLSQQGFHIHPSIFLSNVCLLHPAPSRVLFSSLPFRLMLVYPFPYSSFYFIHLSALCSVSSIEGFDFLSPSLSDVSVFRRSPAKVLIYLSTSLSDVSVLFPLQANVLTLLLCLMLVCPFLHLQRF